MAPSEHLSWLEDNVRWYERLDDRDLTSDVPSCPGWDIEHVVNHLSFGVGLAYPAAVTAPSGTDPSDVFADVEYPKVFPHGTDARLAFSRNMARCLDHFREVDPDAPCWTYGGPGVAAFWFRRAAIETTLHRMDVAEALGHDIAHLTNDRAADAIAESITFALPLAATRIGAPSGELVVDSSCLNTPASIGAGGRADRAILSGEPHHVLNALWGRHLDRVDIDGDRAISDQWLGLVEAAFGGAP